MGIDPSGNVGFAGAALGGAAGGIAAWTAGGDIYDIGAGMAALLWQDSQNLLFKD
jgi:hypothetical protein